VPKIVQGEAGAAHHQGVRTGNYSATIYLICPRFTGYENSLDRPKCLIFHRDGRSKSHSFCFSVVAIMPRALFIFQNSGSKACKSSA
jgi:hypothetical protein